MKKDKPEESKNKTFNLCVASTVVVIIAYGILSAAGSTGELTTSQSESMSLFVAIGSIFAAATCVASFIAKQQRALSVLFFAGCLVIAGLAFFAYSFSGYGSGGY